ncbi:putative ABC1 protein At2g40090 [Bidens hawaiensis]|uniref:putative ABC1 protein At2g40090 n=1 Tax=Bidens hawaiensis TaxID=980011 RepID=UPI00404A13F7
MPNQLDEAIGNQNKLFPHTIQSGLAYLSLSIAPCNELASDTGPNEHSSTLYDHAEAFASKSVCSSDSSGVITRGRRKPQLVLLDHGLYKKLDVSTRTNYAALWKADAKGIKENCMKLGAGEDLYALFAGILTMRPWNRVIDPAVDHLAIQGNDHSERQMYASQYFPQITVLLHKLPRVILLMLKTNDCLRSVNNALIQRPSVESFIIIGRVSSEALIEEKLSHASSLFTYLFVCFEQISLEARFFIMQVALWMLQFRTAFS